MYRDCVTAIPAQSAGFLLDTGQIRRAFHFSPQCNTGQPSTSHSNRLTTKHSVVILPHSFCILFFSILRFVPSSSYGRMDKMPPTFFFFFFFDSFCNSNWDFNTIMKISGCWLAQSMLQGASPVACKSRAEEQLVTYHHTISSYRPVPTPFRVEALEEGRHETSNLQAFHAVTRNNSQRRVMWTLSP